MAYYKLEDAFAEKTKGQGWLETSQPCPFVCLVGSHPRPVLFRSSAGQRDDDGLEENS